MDAMDQTLIGRPAPDVRSLTRAGTAFDYDDVTLIPRLPSTLAHRSDAVPDTAFGPVALRVPLIGSPMPDVCGLAMCTALAGGGALGIMHRFQPIGEQLRRVREAAQTTDGAVGAAVGVTDDYQERFVRLVE